MIHLLEYQRKALKLTVEAFKVRMEALVVMATGLGKTIVAAFWAKRELKKKRKGLFLCHDNGILEQAMGEFRKVLGNDAKLATFFGIDKDFDADKADIVFASFQTYVKWKNAFFEDEFDFIIVDESHHGQASTFKEVIQYFKPKKLLGITATPDRADLKDIREIFGEEVVDYPLEEAIANGWLSPVEYHILNDNLSHWKLKKIIKGVLEEGQRVSVKQLNETIFINKRDEEIARTIQEYAGTDKKVVIFCEKPEHAENFQKYLDNATTYHCRVKGGRKENRARLSAFREGFLQNILAVNKFNEGIDVPDAEVIVFLRCTDSRTIFYQQLGRGLRKIDGKEKVIVLDFVANCERLAMVKEMAHRVKEFAGNNFILSKDVLQVSGLAFDFVFSDDQVDILDLIKRINEPFYETWQEASIAAALCLVNFSRRCYAKNYHKDPKLPSNPNKFYNDFPGWLVFLGRKEVELYDTWQKASHVAINSQVEDQRDYKARYKEIDLRLPSHPDSSYSDFPGWAVFLGRKKREFYKTCKDASNAAIKLKIPHRKRYTKKYREDCKLPANPDKVYKDFPGWSNFLGVDSYYVKWQEASKAISMLEPKVNNGKEYRKRYREDPKLPGDPYGRYEDFPGWAVFLGGEKKEFYETWQEANKATKKIKNIINIESYQKFYKKDSKLPSNPNSFYEDFPGFTEFFGGTKKIFYKTWQEASGAAVKLESVSTQLQYRKNYKKDSKLPSDPDKFYKDFPGWTEFFGGTKKIFYETWQEASAVVINFGWIIPQQYYKNYKLDPGLPSDPENFYKDFPGWDKFLGKE